MVSPARKFAVLLQNQRSVLRAPRRYRAREMSADCEEL